MSTISELAINVVVFFICSPVRVIFLTDTFEQPQRPGATHPTVATVARASRDDAAADSGREVSLDLFFGDSRRERIRSCGHRRPEKGKQLQ